METFDTIKLIFWLNGKAVDSCFTLGVPSSIDTIKKLKEFIFIEKNYNKTYIDKVIIYNHKGIEIEDCDIQYLTNDQVLYISFDLSKFSILNYVNEYQFVNSIKKGGYAEVYLAKNALTKELVSIKKTDLHNFSSEDLYNISREAVYLSTLIHKNIIKIYNSYTYDDCLYNVMQYAEGGELTQLLVSNDVIPERRIKDIFIQIHNAVKFIHSKNVIHRDLKPNNILFLDKEKTQIVLIDFGISGNCNGSSREVIKAGTLKYVPPEVISGEGYQSSPKIDIWAIGIILYLINFKEFPFEGNDNEVMNKIINQKIKFPTGKKIRKSLVNLIEGLLEKNPTERIDINDSMFDEWYVDEGDDFVVFEKEKEKEGNIGRSQTMKNKRTNFNFGGKLINDKRNSKKLVTVIKDVNENNNIKKKK